MAANGTQAPAPPPPPATSGGNSTSVRQVVAGVVVGVLAVAAALFYWWYTRQSKSQSRADGRKQEPSSAAAAGRVENSSPPAPAPAEEQQDGRATPGDADLEWQHACKLLLRASSAEHMPFSGTPRSYASGRSRQLHGAGSFSHSRRRRPVDPLGFGSLSPQNSPIVMAAPQRRSLQAVSGGRGVGSGSRELAQSSRLEPVSPTRRDPIAIQLT
eukprot:TRINITY_DN13357_c0_g1_i1.p1 TRINITY_DN13357_c0_g1~~TRINITY_DN13357_c0_g1_i1.p1  ORF type:complete len:214 (+),score=52.02 TRINITY_DN13357_c0_g1_i1:121-762(+)